MASDPEGARRRAQTDQLLAANRAALAAAPRRDAPIDPSRTPVFETGPDGKLRPIPGWTTTGPFEFGRWAHNVDWLGAGRDLAGVAAGALASMGLPGLVSGRSVAGVVGDGLSTADKVTLGAGVYRAGDAALNSVEPKTRPKHW